MPALSNLLAILSLDDSPFLKTLDSSQSATDKFTKNLSKVGGGIVTGALTAAGVAAAAVGGFLASSIEPASDLNETLSKTTVVFGDNADAIIEWGANADTALGLSQNSALSAAATYGNLFRAMNISEDASSNMSTNLVELAADLASFNNMDPTEVLDKLRAGISGESEPLKTLGVNINEALLKQRALDDGLWDGVGTLDAAAKAQAAYALIMDQTKLAQGDFGRTSDGLANQQRILAAQFENIKATVGGALLPVITQFATTLSEYLSRPETIAFITMLTEKLAQFAQDAIAYIPQVVAWFQNIFTFLQNNEGIVIGIFAALGAAVLAWAVTTAVAAWTAMAPFLPVIAVLLLIGAVVYLVYQAWTNNWGGIQEKTAAVMEFIRNIVNTVITWVSSFINGELGVISQLFSAAWQNIQTLFQAFKAAFNGDWYQFGALLREAWDNAWQTIFSVLKTVWENIKSAVKTGIENVKSFFTETDWGAVGRAIIEGIANGIRNGVGMIRDAAMNAARAALDAAKGFLGIHSPSKVFEMQVGYQMAAGVAMGWESGLGSLMPETMGNLAPASVNGQLSDFSGQGIGGGGLVINVDVRSDGVTDEKDVANKIGAAVGVILREKGLA